MIPKLKTLGLAAVAILAMSAIAASAAQASEFHTEGEKYPVNIHATQVAEHVLEVDTVDPNNDEVKCKIATFTGQAASKSSTVTVNAEYDMCKAFGLTATVTTTGCDYTIHSGATVAGPPHRWDGTVDVECESGKFIKIKTATCEVQVTTQTGLSNVMIINDVGTPNYVTVNPEVTNIAYHVTIDGSGCPLTKTETRTDGIYKGTTAAQGAFRGLPINVTVQ